MKKNWIMEIPNPMTKERLAKLLREGASYKDFILKDGRLYYKGGQEQAGTPDPQDD